VRSSEVETANAWAGSVTPDVRKRFGSPPSGWYQQPWPVAAYTVSCKAWAPITPTQAAPRRRCPIRVPNSGSPMANDVVGQLDGEHPDDGREHDGAGGIYGRHGKDNGDSRRSTAQGRARIRRHRRRMWWRQQGMDRWGLSWSASSGATSYNLKRSTTNGGPYTTIASPTTTSYTDTGVTNGTTYYYVVSAVNTAGESANSSQVSATPQVPVPPPPTNVVATAGNAQVGLSRSASSGATSYGVKRSTTNGGPYTTIASPTTTGYTDTGLTNGTT
jgi:hypothetical protein